MDGQLVKMRPNLRIVGNARVDPFRDLKNRRSRNAVIDHGEPAGSLLDLPENRVFVVRGDRIGKRLVRPLRENDVQQRLRYLCNGVLREELANQECLGMMRQLRASHLWIEAS